MQLATTGLAVLLLSTFTLAQQKSAPSFTRVLAPPPGPSLANADDCNTGSDAVVGQGTYSFDLTGASQGAEGQTSPLCNFFSPGPCIDSDIWFSWEADAAGDARLETCGLTGTDTKLAVYTDDSGCPTGDAIACNDDACGLQSSVTFAVTPGEVYLVQLGTFCGSAPGSGSIDISISTPSEPDGDMTISRVGGIGAGDFQYYGTSGGERAYSFATTSCNEGNVELPWGPSGSSTHPVIGQNIFRVHEGRLEQLGYSWLKHGFCAVNENTCGTCQGTDCSTLGIGCADTYGSFLNDGQSGNGKADVNAVTGVHNDLSLTVPSGSTSVLRGRLRVETAKMGLSGARYFAEAQYVYAADHQAGNGRNNVSYREINTSAGSGSIDGTGFTVRMYSCGVEAWQEVHPDVVLTELPFIDEGGPGVHGYFVLGYRAWQLGGGDWRYEYALQNLTSDASASRFSIPTPCGSPGIYDVTLNTVAHHSGSPYSNDAWTLDTSGGAISVYCESFATNPNANAIRWGETLSFGFTSTQSPADVTGAVDLFKASGTLSATVPSPCAVNDCDGDGVPDEREEDCDGNGVPDDCESLPDCNGNGMPDPCESFTDCNTNGIPDECDADLDGNGVPDECQIETYCRAKRNSAGCRARIGFTGLPSLTGADDFHLTASQVIGASSGTLLWSLRSPGSSPALRDGVPAGAGLCLQGARVLGTQAATGNPGACDGTVAFHFSQADMASAGLAAGLTVHAQILYTDPDHPDGSGLAQTAAIRFPILP